MDEMRKEGSVGGKGQRGSGPGRWTKKEVDLEFKDLIVKNLTNCIQ